MLKRRFLTIVELHQFRHDSDGADAAGHRLADKVALLERFGVDVVTITESENAKFSHSSLETARVLQDASGLRVVPHLTLRGRKKSGAKALVTGARAAGLDTLLVIQGDRFSFQNGGYRFASEMVRHLVSLAPDLTIGAACNPHAPRDREFLSVRAKVAAGAKYLVSQPVFSAEQYREYVEWLASNNITIPVIAGILPLKSDASISFVEKHIPEVAIPEEVKALHLASEDMESACIAFTRRLIRELKEAGAPGIDIYSRGDVALVGRILSQRSAIQESGAILAEPVVS